ncbi:MAG: T9SS type A sorting domain-containing protein [Bacteroidia bacterium]
MYFLAEYLNVPDDPTNIVSINNDAEFRISPNPFRSSTILSSVNAITKIFNVEITDLSGKAVRKYENQTLPLSIDRIDLSPGTYLLKLTLENKIRWVGRMVVVD